MTKEETIKKLIDIAKDGVKNPLDAYCHTSPCLTCPFQEEERAGCAEGMVNELVDRLIKAEESQKAETNLEHYILDKRVDVHIRNEDEVWHLIFKVGTDDACYESRNRFNAIDWLLEPYKPPKFKLTQFGYDLLDFCKQYNDELVIEDWAVLKDMHDKGHYKGIPKETKIRDILDNAEVITND